MAESPNGKKSFTTYMTVPYEAKRTFWRSVHCCGAATAPAAFCPTTVNTPAAAETTKNGAFSNHTPLRSGLRLNQSMARSVMGSTTAAGLDATDNTNATQVSTSQPGPFLSR